MLKSERINFLAKKIAPNPLEATYWIDLNEDPQGTVWKWFDPEEDRWKVLLLGNLEGTLDAYTKYESDKRFASASSVEELANAVNLKLDILISKVNIKTINGQSILGPGNLVLERGLNANQVQDLIDESTKDLITTDDAHDYVDKEVSKLRLVILDKDKLPKSVYNLIYNDILDFGSLILDLTITGNVLLYVDPINGMYRFTYNKPDNIILYTFTTVDEGNLVLTCNTINYKGLQTGLVYKRSIVNYYSNEHDGITINSIEDDKTNSITLYTRGTGKGYLSDDGTYKILGSINLYTSMEKLPDCLAVLMDDKLVEINRFNEAKLYLIDLDYNVYLILTDVYNDSLNRRTIESNQLYTFLYDKTSDSIYIIGSIDPLHQIYNSDNPLQHVMEVTQITNTALIIRRRIADGICGVDDGFTINLEDNKFDSVNNPEGTTISRDLHFITEGDGKDVLFNDGLYRNLLLSVDFSNYLAKDNTTPYTPTGPYNPATKKYVDDEIADLIDSAPDVLDTLKELADALNNNPNFATDIINLISTKADKVDVGNVNLLLTEAKVIVDAINEHEKQINDHVYLMSQINKDLDKLELDLDKETELRQQADSLLLINIDKEYFARQEADKQLLNNIDQVDAKLDQEISDRIEGDNNLNEAINKVASDLAEESEIRAQEDTAIREEIALLESDINKEITNINNQITNINNDITEINKKNDSLDLAIADIQGDITNINLDITNIEGDIADIEGDITTINSNISNINNNISNILGDISNILGDISNINNDISNINNDITNIESNISNIEGDITNIEGDITNLDSSITNIEGDITNINNQITEIVQGNIDLPIASSTLLGAVKIGSGVNVTVDGTISVDEVNWSNIEGKPDTFPTDWGDITNKPSTFYTLPVASTTTLGGIKVGNGLSIESDGKLNVTDTTVTWDEIQGKPGSFYTLPVATTTVLGGVKSVAKVNNYVESASRTAQPYGRDGAYGDGLQSSFGVYYDSDISHVTCIYTLPSTSSGFVIPSYIKEGLVNASNESYKTNMGTIIVYPEIPGDSSLYDVQKSLLVSKQVNFYALATHIRNKILRAGTSIVIKLYNNFKDGTESSINLGYRDYVFLRFLLWTSPEASSATEDISYYLKPSSILFVDEGDAGYYQCTFNIDDNCATTINSYYLGNILLLFFEIVDFMVLKQNVVGSSGIRCIIEHRSGANGCSLDRFYEGVTINLQTHFPVNNFGISEGVPNDDSFYHCVSIKDDTGVTPGAKYRRSTLRSVAWEVIAPEGTDTMDYYVEVESDGKMKVPIPKTDISGTKYYVVYYSSYTGSSNEFIESSFTTTSTSGGNAMWSFKLRLPDNVGLLNVDYFYLKTTLQDGVDLATAYRFGIDATPDILFLATSASYIDSTSSLTVTNNISSIHVIDGSLYLESDNTIRGTYQFYNNGNINYEYFAKGEVLIKYHL